MTDPMPRSEGTVLFGASSSPGEETIAVIAAHCRPLSPRISSPKLTCRKLDTPSTLTATPDPEHNADVQMRRAQEALAAMRSFRNIRMPATRIQASPRANPMKPRPAGSARTPLTIAANPSQRGSAGRRTVAMPAPSKRTANPPKAAKTV